MNVETGAETQTSVGDDVRAAIAKLSGDASEVTQETVVETPEVIAEPSETPEAKAERLRDEKGKFAKKEESVAGAETTDIQNPDPTADQTQAAEPIKPPASLKPAIKAKWGEISPEIQAEFIRLESTQQKGMQKVAEDANFGRALRDVVSPHEATFRALGVNAPQAVDALLKADYRLRTAHPAEKSQYLLQLAKQYGADMSVFQAAPADGQNPQQPTQLDPAVQTLWNELQQLKQASQRQQTEREQTEATQAQAQIQSFAADPKNEFFEDLREDMAILINSGRAKDLAEAYEMASYANPEVRQAVLDRQFAEREAKRKADQAKAVESKKAAGVSLRGSGPAQVAPAAKDESVGETIRRVMASQGRI